MARARNGRLKPVPQRTCIACRKTRAKWELVRVVRTPGGMVEIDLRGKKAGRGAYLCQSQGCWEVAVRKKRLDYALKIEVGPQDRAGLLEFAKTLATGDGHLMPSGDQGERFDDSQGS